MSAAAAPLPPIEVRRWGERGREVVVLHGGPGAPGSVASLARALSTRFRVLEPLQRRSGSVPLTVDRHLADLAAVAPDAAVLVGHSWGAMLALSFAAEHPGRVSAVALVGCGTYDLASRAAYKAGMAERLGAEGRARFARLQERLAAESDPAQADALRAVQWRDAERAQAFDPLPDAEPRLPPDRIGHEETWRDALVRQESGREPAAFASIRAPVAMFHGVSDPHPGRATWETLRRHVAGIEYVELAECGHTPWLERRARETFLDRLAAWIDAAPVTAPAVARGSGR